VRKESEALKKHYDWQGKIEVTSRSPVNTKEDLTLAYTPGVADASRKIVEDPEAAYQLTRKNNRIIFDSETP